MPSSVTLRNPVRRAATLASRDCRMHDMWLFGPLAGRLRRADGDNVFARRQF
jgi:hypothetical protein